MGAKPPEWLLPMALGDELNRRILTNVEASDPIEPGQIVAIDTVNDALSYLCAKKAMADGTHIQNGALYIAETVATTPSTTSRGNRGDKFWAVTSTVQSGDTSTAAKGDPVWLSDATAGGWTLVRPGDSARRRQIGQVLVVSASGYVLLEPGAYAKRAASGAAGGVQVASYRVQLVDLPAAITTGLLTWTITPSVAHKPLLGAAIYIADSPDGPTNIINVALSVGAHTYVAGFNVINAPAGTYLTAQTDPAEFIGFVDVQPTGTAAVQVSSDVDLDTLTDFDITFFLFFADVALTP